MISLFIWCPVHFFFYRKMVWNALKYLYLLPTSFYFYIFLTLALLIQMREYLLYFAFQNIFTNIKHSCEIYELLIF